MRERAVGLPPLNRRLVRDLISQTRISRMLEKFRHMPAVDMEALEQALLRVSEIACELPMVKELDINPWIVDDLGAVAVDARVVIDFHSPAAERYSHMAIYPYPNHPVVNWQQLDSISVVIRPIGPEDAGIEQDFIRQLSGRARYFRFMQAIDELSPQMQARFTQIDYDREMALIAVVEQDNREIEIGVARYVINPHEKS
jgi:acetyltransferase